VTLQHVAQVALCTIFVCALIAYLMIRFSDEKHDFAQGIVGLACLALYVFLCVAAAGWVR
jgi:hypothetical protein